MYVYLLITLLIGFGLGFALAYMRNPARKVLEKALAQKEEELASYQNQVAIHFQRTAELVDALHTHQDNIIAHLCEGAKTLRPHTLSHEIVEPTDFLEEAPPRVPKDYWVAETTL